MTAIAMLARLHRAVGRRCRPDDCPGSTTVLIEQTPTGLRDNSGELYDPNTAHRCPMCGYPHPVEIEEIIVTPVDANRLEEAHAGR